MDNNKKELVKQYKELGNVKARLMEMAREYLHNEKRTKKRINQLYAAINVLDTMERDIFESIKPKNAMSWDEFESYMKKNRDKKVTGVIVYRQSNWTKKYTLKSRSYRVCSDAKAFDPSAGGYSLFGSNLDCSDICVRLERVDWRIEYCYIEK